MCYVRSVYFSKDKCRCDNLWKKLFKEKWGELIGDAAYKEWQWHLAVRKRQQLFHQRFQNQSLGSLVGVPPALCLGSCLENRGQSSSSVADDSFMSWYISLHSGEFWFPAQVFKDGELKLSDALLHYDFQTDKFVARYSYNGRDVFNITWDRLRATPSETRPHVLHVSACLNDLKPGDHIEIQWRSSKEASRGLAVCCYRSLGIML
ncbi:F-box protein [Quillaja saponaria]|uniref:F-box protein n=1 Tax=Quillaja saponaria TaxID=32244 RepID=A0AAD7VDS4_QUISA|nr:F-box protein [Quillaja saponaria]